MTDEEVIHELTSDSKLNKARQIFSSSSAKIETAQLQRRPISPVQVRRMEFQAIREIAKVLGVEL